jgi:hypothetical protein
MYFFFSPFTMGSISLQSIQVTAKNSIKIKSLCLGVNFATEVCAGIGEADIEVEAITKGVAVTELVACVVTQETNIKETSNTNKKDLRMTDFP